MPPQTQTPPETHDPYAAVRIPNYRAFAVGFVCSGVALQMLGAAVLLEVWKRTHDPLAVGYVGLARSLPVVALVLISGHTVDRYSRRLILGLTSLGFALCAASLAYASYHSASVNVYYLLLAIMGACRAFNGPSRNSLLPLLVPPEVFHNAVTWNSGLFQFSAIVGPLAAGAIFEVFQAAWPVYLATALLCFTFAVITLFLKPRPGTPSKDPLTLKAMFAGIKHIAVEKTVLSAITLDLLAVLFGGANALLPIYAEQILHVGEFRYGVLKSATYVGALLMAIVLAHRAPFTRAGRALLLSVAVYGVTIVVFGFSTSFWLSVAALAIGGAVDNVSVVIRHVLVQVRTPDHLRGRVGAVNSVFIECSNELGSYESGLVASWFGPVFSAVSGGVGTLVVVLGVAAAFPALRSLGKLKEEDESQPT